MSGAPLWGVLKKIVEAAPTLPNPDDNGGADTDPGDPDPEGPGTTN